MATPYRYSAFISYSHKDSNWATWLQKKIETYRVPRGLADANPEISSLSPVFRDRSDFASAPSLSKAVEAAATESYCLIVICSPGAAKSLYVNEEILLFQRSHRGHLIFPIIVEGEPNATDPEMECFPPALRGSATNILDAPLAADLRSTGDGRNNALLKIIAGILRVHFDDLKQRHFHRRQRQLVLLSSVSLLLAVIMSVLAGTAYIARQDAERRRVQAEDLVGFMLGDLRKKLEPVGRLDVLDAVGDKAMAYFASLPPEDWSDKASLQRAMALRQIGEVRKYHGKLAASKEAFLESKRLLESAHKRFPKSLEVMFELGQSHFWVADIHYSTNDIELARQEIEAYRDLSQQLTMADPGNDDYWLEFSYAESNLGSLDFKKNEFAKARVKFESALSTQQVLLNRNPGDRNMQLEIAATYSWLGSIAKRQWDTEAAIDFHLRETDIRRATNSNSDRPNQIRFANALVHLAQDNYIVGRTAEALQLDLEGLKLVATLSELDPENFDWQKREMVTRNYCARDHLALGHTAESLHLLEINRTDYAGLNESESKLTRRSKTYTLILLANTHLILGEPKLALKHADSALDELNVMQQEGDIVDLFTRLRFAEAGLAKGKSLQLLNMPEKARAAALLALDNVRPTKDDGAELVIGTYDLLSFLGNDNDAMADRLRTANIRYSLVGHPLKL